MENINIMLNAVLQEVKSVKGSVNNLNDRVDTLTQRMDNIPSSLTKLQSYSDSQMTELSSTPNKSVISVPSATVTAEIDKRLTKEVLEQFLSDQTLLKIK